MLAARLLSLFRLAARVSAFVVLTGRVVHIQLLFLRVMQKYKDLRMNSLHEFLLFFVIFKGYYFS
jgi:competence protein ComGF